MNCAQFRRIVESAVETRSPLQEQAAALHLGECSREECVRLWQETELLDRAIAHWRSAQPELDLASAVAADWRADRAARAASGVRPASDRAAALPGGPYHEIPGASVAHRSGALRRVAAARRPFANRSAPWAAVSAGLVLCVVTAAFVGSGREGTLRLTSVDVPPRIRTATALETEFIAPAAPARAIANRADEESLRDAGLSYVGMAQNATRMMTDMVVLALGEGDEMEDPALDTGWIEEWRRQLAPVGVGVDEAVDDILHVLPQPAPST